MAVDPFASANVGGGMITEAGATGFAGAINGGLTSAGSFVADNPMMAYLLLNTAATAFNPSQAEELIEVETQREKRQQRRIARSTDVSGVNIKRINYKPNQSTGLLNRRPS